MVLSSLLPIPADHPAYQGHFPGNPILPGVVLLDAALTAVAIARVASVVGWQVLTAKFHSIVRPGDALMLDHEALSNGTVRFVIRNRDHLVASGMLKPTPALDGATGG